MICFGYPVIASLVFFLEQRENFLYDNARTARALLYETGATIICLGILRVRGRSFAQYPLRMSARSTLSGVGLWALCFLGMVFAYDVMVAIGAWPTNAPVSMNMTAAMPLGVTFILFNSFFEETFVCGYLIESIQDKGPLLAIGSSALLRSSYHLYQGPGEAISILGMGIIFALAYWRWRNLWPLMVAHTIINLLGWIVQDYQTPD